MKKSLLKILICPVSKGALKLSHNGKELWSKHAQLAYPIRDGVPVLLQHEARSLSEKELNEIDG